VPPFQKHGGGIAFVNEINVVARRHRILEHFEPLKIEFFEAADFFGARGASRD
jgi:hypothetical protein